MSDSITMIEGVLERVVYVNEENNYTVARVQEERRFEPTTIVGNLLSLTPGETLRLWGRWVEHKNFGRQFQVESYKPIAPATLNGIKKYLGSGLVKGIGPKLAERLVKAFGLATLDVIDTQIEKLREVDGIGEKRVAGITAAWREQREIRQIMVFLQSHGVGSANAAKIYKEYGGEATEIVKHNPYRLATDITGIGFKTADDIAQNLGIDKNSQMRAEAGIVFALQELTGEGHVYCPYEELVEKARGMLGIRRDVIDAALDRQKESESIVIEQGKADRPVYLRGLRTAEMSVAIRLRAINRAHSVIPEININKAFEWVEGLTSMELAPTQELAIETALKNKVTVITGGPGVGKTTIVNCIIKILGAKKLKVLLAAPTGRAAKRMSETSGREAKTIHRLLKFNPSGRGFDQNENNLLDADVIIIDESSMIDTVLMHHLVKAIPLRASLVLVGDVDQLPSVGPGMVLKDIIGSGSVEVVRLTEIFRQAEDSLIVTNAHRINNGEFPLLKGADKDRLVDFYFIREEDPAKVVALVKELCAERIPRKFGYDPVDDIQVLAPMHRGTVGASNLNLELQNVLNRGDISVERSGRGYRLSDKVMQIRNNYEKDVFNGDIGRIVSINRIDQTLTVRFDDEVVYDFIDLDELAPAYSISVHKSQGSEYPVVILPFMTQHYMMLQRNLLYTAITRAKKLAVIVGSTKAIAMAVKNNKISRRYTLLKERLRAAETDEWVDKLMERFGVMRGSDV